MAKQWVKTKFVGVRYREHATRKHGIRPDRYYALNYKAGDKVKGEGLGWESEGWTAEKAFNILSGIRANLRMGSGAQSLTELREVNQEKAEAKKAEQAAQKLAAVTFREFWEQTYLPDAQARKKPLTVESEKTLYRHWLSTLYDIPLQKLNHAKVEGVVTAMRTAGKAAKTIIHAMALVSQVWNHAALLDVVKGENPARHVKKPQADNRRMRFLTQEEATTLLEALKERSIDTHDEALLSLFAGLRAGEIHSLEWSDVDLGQGTLFIRDPKNRKNRHAYITPEVAAVLHRRGEGKERTGRVFPAKGDISRRWISASFPRVVQALGLNAGITDPRQKVVFHTLRHTFASWLVQAGVPLYTVATLMGHATITMTTRYSHLAPDNVRAAAMGLSGALAKKTSKVIEFQKRVR